MKILSLNCQKGHQPGLANFLEKTIVSNAYDFLLLQEATENVLAILKSYDSYKLITGDDTDLAENNWLCIAHKNGFQKSKSVFRSFGQMRKDPVRGFGHPAFGFLCATFEYETKSIAMGNVHLHSGVDKRVRELEAHEVKQMINYLGQEAPILFGGDFNFGFPGERLNVIKLFSPEFVCATESMEATLDSRYSEYANHLPNQVAFVLAKVGLGIKLKADQIFIDTKTAQQKKMYFNVLSDRVSDHNPIEFYISD